MNIHEDVEEVREMVKGIARDCVRLDLEVANKREKKEWDQLEPSDGDYEYLGEVFGYSGYPHDMNPEILDLFTEEFVEHSQKKLSRYGG